MFWFRFSEWIVIFPDDRRSFQHAERFPGRGAAIHDIEGGYGEVFEHKSCWVAKIAWLRPDEAPVSGAHRESAVSDWYWNLIYE